MKIVVLDDYQRVAATFAAGTRSTPTCEFVHEHLDRATSWSTRCASAEVVVAMRERTPFGADLLDRLPGLRLLVTTGPGNAAIDLAAAAAQGVTVCGTRSLASRRPPS